MPEKNILAVFCDELTRKALGFYGNADIATPNLDRLARKGINFPNACSTYPVCVPFRFTLMTGEYAHSRSIPAIGYQMSPAERTLADEFKENGYETLYIGKWHLEGGQNALPCTKPPQYEPFPMHKSKLRNWDKFILWEKAGSYYKGMYFEDDDPQPHYVKEHQVDGIFGLAADRLKNRKYKDRPFFCMVSTNAPHPPYQPPPEDKERWSNKKITMSPNVTPEYFEKKGNLPQHEIDRYYKHLESGELEEKYRLYYAMIEHVDREFGKLMNWLDENKLLDTTAVVFFADHGECIGNHGLTYCKQFPFEESIGIPLFIYDPECKDRAGMQIDAPVCTEDLFPTLLGIAGLKPQNNVPGLNLAHYWKNPDKNIERNAILLEFYQEARPHASLHGHAWRGIRTKRFKYTVYGGTHERAQPWHFFDLENDPYELNNLVGNPEWHNEIKRHHELLVELLRQTGDHYPIVDYV